MHITGGLLAIRPPSGRHSSSAGDPIRFVCSHDLRAGSNSEERHRSQRRICLAILTTSAIYDAMRLRRFPLLRLLRTLFIAMAVIVGPIAAAGQTAGMISAGSVAASGDMDAHSCDSCGEEIALGASCPVGVCHAIPVLTTEILWTGVFRGPIFAWAADVDLRGLTARPSLQPPRPSILL